jgi:hypothetical protein
MIMVRALFVLFVASLTAGAAVAADRDNPSCPQELNAGPDAPMTFKVEEQGGMRVLRAEGVIDKGLVGRLSSALASSGQLDEIWLRSRGGDAKVGNEAGLLILSSKIPTRIPFDWACASACNFMFMGGFSRTIDPDAQFAVHMFTHVADEQVVENRILKKSAKDAQKLIGNLEQQTALLASADNDFLIKVGISRKLLSEVMYRQKAIPAAGGDESSMRCLTQAELRRYNVVNTVPVP